MIPDRRRTWLSTVVRILSINGVALAIGWYLGHPLQAVLLSLAGLVVFWLYQLRVIQRWLQHPEQPPPDSFGIWGDILSRIYRQQKEAREARSRLQSTVDYLRESFAAMRDGVVIVAEQGTIQWFNEAAGELLDLRESQDIGRPLLHLVRVPEFHRYFMQGDHSKPLEYHTNGDDRRYLQLQITQFGDGDRLVFVRDVTQMVRTEQIRRDFIGNVSHELRTPLTVISGYVGMFLDNPADLSAPMLRALEQMSQQADRMENLLKELLWLSRIESGERREKREQVDIPCLLAELVEELRATYPQRTIRLEVETARKVVGDYRELYSAVSNLVLNALKYSGEECPVQVTWRKEGMNYLLAVRDQGIGIDPVHLPRLTERFYRVDDSRSSSTGGTGLGLAIVKHVAAAHHAQLRVASEPGRGSEFTLVFPCEKVCVDIDKCA